jgi:predicted nucleic acid-binding protein
LKAIIADTGPLYAETDKADRYHTQARSELQPLNESKAKLLVPYPILLEAYKLVLYKCGFNATESFTRRLTAETNLINLTPQDYQLARQLIGQFPDQKITLFDALVACLSNHTKIPVWTYDYHFDIMNVQVWR